MNRLNTLAMEGGHKIVNDTTAYGATDYHFKGFIVQEDAIFTSLVMGDEDVTQAGVTYFAGIYYGAPSKLAPGYYTEVTLASGSIVLVLTLDSPTKY